MKITVNKLCINIIIQQYQRWISGCENIGILTIKRMHRCNIRTPYALQTTINIKVLNAVIVLANENWNASIRKTN